MTPHVLPEHAARALDALDPFRRAILCCRHGTRSRAALAAKVAADTAEAIEGGLVHGVEGHEAITHFLAVDLEIFLDDVEGDYWHPNDPEIQR